MFNNVSFLRNIGTSVKKGKTWLFLEPPVLEAAGLSPGDRIEMTVLGDRRAPYSSEVTPASTSYPAVGGLVGRKNVRSLQRRDYGRHSTAKRVDILVADGILIVL